MAASDEPFPLPREGFQKEGEGSAFRAFFPSKFIYLLHAQFFSSLKFFRSLTRYGPFFMTFIEGFFSSVCETICPIPWYYISPFGLIICPWLLITQTGFPRFAALKYCRCLPNPAGLVFYLCVILLCSLQKAA